MAFSCALITFDGGKHDGVFFKDEDVASVRRPSPGLRPRAVPRALEGHGTGGASGPYLPLATLDPIERVPGVIYAAGEAPILSPFCFLDRRALVCSPSKKADYISGGLKRPLVFSGGRPASFSSVRGNF